MRPELFLNAIPIPHPVGGLCSGLALDPVNPACFKLQSNLRPQRPPRGQKEVAVVERWPLWGGIEV